MGSWLTDRSTGSCQIDRPSKLGGGVYGSKGFIFGSVCEAAICFRCYKNESYLDAMDMGFGKGRDTSLIERKPKIHFHTMKKETECGAHKCKQTLRHKCEMWTVLGMLLHACATVKNLPSTGVLVTLTRICRICWINV